MLVLEETLAVRRQAFLDSFAYWGSIKKAIRETPENLRIDRKTVYNWLKRDPSFVEDMRNAQHEYREGLQDLAHERIQNPQGNRGSDGLLSHMLNANWPEKFRQDAKPVDEGTAKQTLAAITALAKKQVEAEQQGVVEGEVVRDSGGGEVVGGGGGGGGGGR